MSKGKQLAKNTLIILLGKICTQFISFLLLPLYTSVLVSSEFGVVDLIITYIGLLVPIVTLQLESALFRYLIDERENENEKENIITNALFSVIIQMILALILFKFVLIFINVNYQYYIVVMIISTIISNILLQIARGLGDNIGYSIGSVIAGGITIILNVILLLVLHLGPIGIFLSNIVANIVCAIFIFIRTNTLKYINSKYICKKTINKLLNYSIPLVSNGIIWWIMNVSDRSIITIFLGASANGIYAISNKFPGVFISIYNIFNMSWTESAALYINSEDRDEFFSNTISSMFKLFSSICLGIIACMPFIFPIMINKEYSDAYNYIPILMISTLFNVVVGLLSVIYVAKKLTKEISKTSFWSGGINICINLVLIKYIGIYAAAISTLISFMSMAIYRYINVQKYVKVKLDKKLIVQTIVIFSISIYFYYINKPILNLVNLGLVVIYAVMNNKQIIYKTLNIINKKVRIKK